MLRYLWISALVLVIDQVSKWVVVDKLIRAGEVPLIPFVQFTLVYNACGSFGLLCQLGMWFFVGVAVAASIIIILMLRRLTSDDIWTAIALTLVLGGALGNLVDRLLYSYVIDFIDVYYRGKCIPPFHPDAHGACHWPAFNIADSAITIGAILLIVDVFLARKKSVESDLDDSDTQ